MPILSSRELPRTFDRKFGESFVAERQFVVTFDGTPPTVDEAATHALGVPSQFGLLHPEYPIRLVGAQLEENYEESQYHTLVKLQYGGAVQNNPDDFIQPLLRPDRWSIQTQGVTVPALFYYVGGGNGTTAPLTNSAFDYFESLTSDEAQVKVVIQTNRQAFPNGLFVPLTNAINSSPWLGGATHCWKCQGLGAELKYEVFGETLYRYWEIKVELLYRQTGWPLQLPDVGFNFIAGNQKRRAMVFDFQNAEWVASPGPVGLDGNGGLTLGAPAILIRRVHPEIDFNSFFAAAPA
jgi:hypothetical protein